MIVSVRNPIRLSEHSEPQPDLALLRPRPDFYTDTHPGPQDVFLMVEVAETLTDYDREVKLPLYAKAGVLEAWLVGLNTKIIEVHREPSPQGYKRVRRYQRGEQLTPESFLNSSWP